jgi:hypothetical protein
MPKFKQILIVIGLAAVVIFAVTAFLSVQSLFREKITCAPSQLKLSSSMQGATGALAGVVTVTNVSSSSCFLESSPNLSLIDSNGTELPVNITSSAPVGEDILAPGGSASFFLVWRNWCGQLGPNSVNLRLSVGTASTPVIAPIRDAGGGPLTGSPRCEDPSASSTLSISAFNLSTPTPTNVTPTPPAATSTAVKSPATSTTVTLSDNNQTINLKVGDSFLLNLGDTYNWRISIAPSGIISRRVNVIVIRGAQGIYDATSPGTTTLSAVGGPFCLSAKPPCAMPSINFNIKIGIGKAQ